MSPRKKAQAAFAAAVVLLLLSGLAGYLSVRNLQHSTQSVIHTHEVQAALGDIDSAVLRAGRARSGYRILGTSEYLAEFEAAVRELPLALRRLRDLTKDNAGQQERCSQLDDLIGRRIALLRESVQSAKSTPGDAEKQADLERRALPIVVEVSSIMLQMRQEEQRLLDIRNQATRSQLIETVATLSVAFLLALTLFSVQYYFLSMELRAREEAERIARESEESMRGLTGRLLHVQDAERRRFSRELHDSLGQYLAGVKMSLDVFTTRRDDSFIVEARQLLEQAIGETRTISHLLHPPLLDDVGLSSAARWYVDGLAQRSGIEVSLNMPDDIGHLPRPVALGLFRVLQESLTNIHRHSESPKADVTLRVLPEQVILKVRDYGKGITPDLLRRFHTKGTNSGVGLAGMRERVRELGGHLNIQPCTPGTVVSVTIPLPPSTVAAADSNAAD